jgi:hypothetical protein
MKNVFLFFLSTLSILFFSCNTGVGSDPSKTIVSPKGTASKMIALKSYGFFPTITIGVSRDIESPDPAIPVEIDREKLNIVSQKPEEILSTILTEDTAGLNELELVDTIVSEGSTAQDVYDKMYAVDPELATDYSDALQSQAEAFTT